MVIFIANGERLSHRLREQYLLSVLRQDISWHENEGAGEVATRITSDMMLIQDAIAEKLPIAASQVFTCVAGFAIAFYRDPRLAGVLVVSVPFLAGSVSTMSAITRRVQTRILKAYSAAGNVAEEALASIRTVVAFNGQDRMAALYASLLKNARSAGVLKAAVAGISFGLFHCFIYLSYGLAFYYGSFLFREGSGLDGGTIINVVFAVVIGSNALGNIGPEMQAFSLGVAAGTKIFATIDRKPDIDSLDPAGDTIAPDQLKGRIELSDVDFSYPSRPHVPVLRGLSLVVEPGTTVALVGESGSGKSTIVQLLERFYAPAAGSISLDGRPLQSLRISWLRRQIGYVSQEPVLLDASVADNVALGLANSALDHADPAARLMAIQDACRVANAHDFISALPEGYNTIVGERGLLLSGGQKQRIAIARAVVANPKILLLDEATSALDSANERTVQAALDNAARGRTTIVVAHRLSTIRNADNIVCMRNGAIVELGTHDELLERQGMYFSLVEAQRLRVDESGNDTAATVAADGPATATDVDAATSGFLSANSEPANGLDDSKSAKRASVSAPKDLEAAPANPPKMTAGYVIKEIAKLNAPELKYTIFGLIAAIISGLANPILAILFSSVLLTFAESPVQGSKDQQAGMLAVLAVCTAIANWIQNWMFGLANEYLTERVRARLFHAMMYQEIAFFDDPKRSTGSLTGNLAADAQKIQGAAGVTLGTILQLFTNVFGGLIVGFIYGWQLTLLAMVLLPLLVLTSYVRTIILRYFSDKAKKAYDQSARLACEHVAAIRTVQSLTAEHHAHAAYTQLLDTPRRDGTRSAWLNSPLYAFAVSANFFSSALLFYVGSRLVAYNNYTIKNMFVVFMAVLFGARAAGRVFSFSPDVAKARAAAQDVLAVLHRTPLIDARPPPSHTTVATRLDRGAVRGEIEFRNVRFDYPARPGVKVLRGLSFTVKPGQFVALVGPSGCGKSTAMALMERFYDPVGGQVLLDGRDLRDLPLRDYRSLVGLVSQEPSLWDMTVEENVAFGCDPPPSRADVENACRLAHIHDFIASLPDGYRTRLGAHGGQLSGGQKQRIAIARALVRRPPVLLLDEATAALDADSERAVQRAIDAAAAGRTTVAIAHRLASIQRADLILVLRDGNVAEAGSHQELYDRRGLYYELVVQQDLSASAP
ncbi:GTPase-activating protein [Cladochytrium tenue]|nr:GTPase-activating protein [Cladochytrium tenue]